MGFLAPSNYGVFGDRQSATSDWCSDKEENNTLPMMRERHSRQQC